MISAIKKYFINRRKAHVFKGNNMNKKQMKQWALAGVLSMAMVGVAVAGGNADFGTTGANNDGTLAVGRIANWLRGSMGQMFAIGALAVGLGIGIVKQSVMSVAVGVGIALAASAGPNILGGIFGAVL